MTLPDFVSPMSDEYAVAQTHPSYWNYSGTIFIGILLLPVFGVGLLFLLWARICVRTTCYVATSMRIVAKTGWLNTRQIEIRMQDIRGIEVERTLMQRILGIGDVEIGTAATEGSEIVMCGVVDPEGFVKNVNALRR
jgi:uncharacterized membrane protein YdbT with pleckstrin-like domain